MIKLGFVSAIVPELSFEEVVSFAAAKGFSCVELMCWPRGKADRKYAGVTHVDAGELDAASAARIKAFLKREERLHLGPGLLSRIPSMPTWKRRSSTSPISGA